MYLSQYLLPKNRLVRLDLAVEVYLLVYVLQILFFSTVLQYTFAKHVLIYIYLHSFKFLLCGLLYVFPVFSFYIKMDLAMLTETFHVL